MDLHISNVVDKIMSIGELHYVITRLAVLMVFRHGRPSYAFLSSIGGVLADVRDEFYRRVVAPYEDSKAKENGDVYQ